MGVAWKIEKGEDIFRNEFEYYLEKYKNDKKIENLIFVFITLQIYIENFLHYKMRTFIKLEFNYNAEKIKNWEKECEFKYINDKTNNKTEKVNKGKLSWLISHVSLQNNEKVIQNKKVIEEKFEKITEIRNALIHGHEISTSGTSLNDNRINSETKEYLCDEKLEKIIKEINILGKNWNELMDIFLENAKALERGDMLYFNDIIVRNN